MTSSICKCHTKVINSIQVRQKPDLCGIGTGGYEDFGTTYIYTCSGVQGIAFLHPIPLPEQVSSIAGHWVYSGPVKAHDFAADAMAPEVRRLTPTSHSKYLVSPPPPHACKPWVLRRSTTTSTKTQRIDFKYVFAYYSRLGFLGSRTTVVFWNPGQNCMPWAGPSRVPV